jgi:CubicO group peptidase (beta-lactamase class C family)
MPPSLIVSGAGPGRVMNQEYNRPCQVIIRGSFSVLYEKDLDVVLQEIMTRWDIPGLAVGIVQGDEIVYAKGFGVQSLETQEPVTLDSVFCVQSVSKCFVATAVMQMEERGKLDLDAPLVQYLPYFQLDDERYRQITIRQALSHTSGMPDIDEMDYVEWMTRPEYDEGAAERFVRGLCGRKLVANPGERFSYSNIAYNVLGDLLAKVSAQSFESVMREQILTPAGMPNSTFIVTDIPVNRLAVPHLRSPEMRVNPIYPYQRADAPASFLHTTIVDLCHWGSTALNRGSNLDQRILSPAGYELMWKPVAKRGSSPSLYEEMGLGWTLGHFKDVKTVSHGGAGFGATAFLLILPEKNCAAVVLCNEESYAHMRVVQAVADTLIGQKPQANTVSSMVPISRALAEGGIDAAYARYGEIKTREDAFYFGEKNLLDLSFQLFMAKKIDLAIEVLGLNTHLYPETIESYLEQAKLYRRKGETAQVKECLLKALSIEPDNATAARLLNLNDL